MRNSNQQNYFDTFNDYEDDEPVHIRTYAQAVAAGEFSRRLNWAQEAERTSSAEQRKARQIERRKAKALKSIEWLLDSDTKPRTRKVN